MRARIASSLDDLGLGQREWADLAAASHTNTVFQSWQWTSSWWGVFGDQYQPFFISAVNGGSVAGIAPLVVRNTRSRGRVVRFLGDGRADYCDFLTASDSSQVLATLFEVIFADKGWDVIELNNIPAASPTVELVTGICAAAKHLPVVEDHFLCPTLVIDGHEGAARRHLRQAQPAPA